MQRSLRERLQGLQRSVSGSTKSREPVSQEDAGVDDNQDLMTQGSLTQIGFQRKHGPLSDFFVREIRYDVLTLHGCIPFRAIFDVDLSGLYTLVGEPFQISDLRFYDTETTGLGTGAGTFAFLHTIGRFEEDEFCLYQYFVDDYSAEEAILHAMEEAHFSKTTILVTFNGKSFDWPMLQGRRAMYRMERQEIAGHIDLLHPARRFWKKRLGTVSLVSVESHVLELERQDDLPGKEAPVRYFQYVDNRDPLVIEPVLLHNAMDVSSLVGILACVANLLSGHAAPETAETCTALAKYFTEWNQYDLAQKCYKASTQLADATWLTYWQKSLFLKRIGMIENARDVWMEIVDKFPESVAPLIELAKLSEHRDKNFPQAQRWVELAMERYRSHGITLPYRASQVRSKVDELEIPSDDRIFAELLHRRNRILRKLK